MIAKRLALAVAGIAGLGDVVFGAVDCGGNIKISNTGDAEAVRKACKTIKGSVTIAEGIVDSINLDGVERIDGDLTHTGCGLLAYEDCGPSPSASISFSSSTLDFVNGSIEFLTYKKLEKVSLPKLRYVWNSVSFRDVTDLKDLDITSLEYVSELILETPKLEKLSLNGIKGFNEAAGFTGGVEIWNSGKLESVDAFFNNPINTSKIESWREGKGLLINQGAIPNVRKINIGWVGMDSLEIGGTNLTVVLGGRDVKSVAIKQVTLRGGILGLERGHALEELDVEKFTLLGNDVMTDLNLPLDSATSITLTNSSSLQSVTLPSKAEEWKNVTVRISDCPSLKLDLENGDDGKKDWVWPKGEMSSVNITSNVSSAFFDSFVANHVTVTGSFSVVDDSGKLDCSIFSNNTLPAGYTCDQKGLGPRLGVSGWQFWTVIAIVAMSVVL